VQNKQPFYWKGVLHELLCHPQYPEGANNQLLNGCYLLSTSTDGNRSQDLQKYLKDAAVLEDALKKEPQNARYMFYLGQSYRNGGDFHQALKAFEQRSRMGGEKSDVFFALFMVGVLQELLGYEKDICLESFIKAHKHCPHRPDPIYKIGQIHMTRGHFLKAYTTLKPYVFLYDLDDLTYLQTNIRDYLLPILFACAAYELKKYQECYETLKKVATLPSLPNEFKENIGKDLANLEILKGTAHSTETQSFPK
jgi:tetratricopeptide (TPR) repeat protein